MKKYFSYSSETGFEYFDTAEEAAANAQELINQIRDESAGDEWPDYVDSVCCGEISKIANGNAIEIVSELGVDCYIDYELESVK